jgi:hypothetical protein
LQYERFKEMSDFQYEEAAMPYAPEESSEPRTAIQQAKHSHERELLAIDGVEGVGIGRNSIGDDAIILYLRSEDVKTRIPHNIGGYPVETKVTGIIDASSANS